MNRWSPDALPGPTSTGLARVGLHHAAPWLTALWAATLLVPSGGCEDDAPPPLQAPRCEPDNEVQVERDLKRGYRALWERHPAEARAAFQAVLERAPGHPQAQAGLVAAQRGEPNTPRPAGHQGGPLWIGGQPIWTGVDIHGVRYRFEDRAAESALAHELGLCPTSPAAAPILPRRAPGGGPLPTDDPVPTVRRVDLLVLRDAPALTTRAAFLHMLAQGRSVHLSIDWDGTIYQHLDLARAATQPELSDLPGVTARAVVIALVNPGDPSRPALPRPSSGTRGAHPGLTREVVSATIQGHAARGWGYTQAQRASLRRLLGALREALPGVPARLPEDAGGEIPRAALPAAARGAVRGIAGALHLSPDAQDPGPGLDWGEIRDALAL